MQIKQMMNPTERNPIIPLGTKTKWGTIEAVGLTGGERYYWMVDKFGGVAMIPAFMVEEDANKTDKA